MSKLFNFQTDIFFGKNRIIRSPQFTWSQYKKKEWLPTSQCDEGNFNYLHHNVMGVTIFSKWLPSSQCDGGNHFLEMVTPNTS